tara:strand:- start:559 stop:957 length:399 start_codon:yes stop_codon:yes gene_type:complete
VNSRNKGRRGEREVIEVIKDLLGIQLEVNYSQTYGGGHDLLGGEPWAIEVKRRKAVTHGDVRQWWKQTTTQARKVELLPCLWHRADRGQWSVVIPDLYALEHKLFPIDDFNCTSTVTPELWAALSREEFKVE